MSIWRQSSTQFITDRFQQYNFEILNLTTLNFARPGTPTDSHTAAMTAERRRLFDQLPRLNTNTHIAKRTSLVQNQNQTSDRNNDNVVTQNVPRIKFQITADPNDNNNDDRDKKNRNNRNVKAYRRASAPAQGMDFNYKQAKKTFSKKTHNHHNQHQHHHHNLLNIPPVHIEVDESVESVNGNHNDNHNHNDHSGHNINVTSSSAISPYGPPSLSPCSSTSSLSSSVDILSPTNKQSFIPNQNFDWPTKPEAHSLPDADDIPLSPAAMFLSSLVSSPIKQPLPDDEGQQVGEYIMGKVIGHGGFSTVKQAYTMDSFTSSMNTVAVKIVKNHVSSKNSDDDDHVQALLEREITIWRRLDHPNIVKMLTLEETDYATFIFSELCQGGTLLDYIKKNRKCEGEGLDEDDARNIFLEIAEGIRYLHNDVRLVHKDIKLDNILLGDDDTWKICDFGLTEFQNPINDFNNIIYSNMVGGSLAYCAPEQLRSPTPLKDPSVDIWSLGVVLFAMVTGQLPFSDSFEPRLQFKIINGRYDESLLDSCRASDELRDLIKLMFKAKPDQRLTISQILEHKWCER